MTHHTEELTTTLGGLSEAERARYIRRRAWFGAVAVVSILSAIIAITVRGGGERPEDVFRRALVAVDSSDLDGIRDAITILESVPETEIRVRLLQGAESLILRNYNAAISHLSQVPPEGELRVPALLLLGESLYSAHRLSESERVFRLLAAEAEENAEAHRWLGAIYYDLGAMDHALDELRQLARLKPHEFQAYRLQGHIFADYEQFQDAISAYEQALERNPPEPIRNDVLMSLAKCQLRENRFTDAMSALEPLPDSALVLALRAECLWRMGQSKQAENAIEHAKRVGPDIAAVLLLEARMAMDAGDAESAILALKQLLERDPHDAEARYQLALAYRDLGDKERYEREIAQHERSKKLRLRLSELNMQAIDRPDDADLREEIANLCAELGKQQLAIVWRRAADACRQTARN